MPKILTICEEICGDLGYELVDVEYVKEKSDYYLKVFIHKHGGVNLDDCQIMSERVSEILDDKDIVKNPYYLEVSSPGLDRPLKTDKDLERNIGKEIEISLYKAIDGQKKYEGKLTAYNKENIIIEIIDNEKILDRQDISIIRLTIKF
jgi:ribosome maturation factor RimP